ncbi:hypothetical protein AB6N24_20215 [Cellulomonas sp. 179-A 4D5 NHS]|uniref:hypothetical protein n=1 Tax=unclassified Cellulomonas TaxID=2620175 RepID=UPI0021616B0C|nr:hypothetical protein [Cellulomonas sp. NS3]
MGQGDTPRRGRGRASEEPAPLGSLSRGEPSVPRGTETCASCGSESLTRLSMVLGDGTAVVFVSCHRCEHKGWYPTDGDGTPLTRDEVLARSGKKA